MGRKRVLRARAFGTNGYVREASLGRRALTHESLAKFVATVTRKMLRGRLDDSWIVAFFSQEYSLRMLRA